MESTGTTGSLAKKCVCRVKIPNMSLGLPVGYTKKIASKIATKRVNTKYGLPCDTQEMMPSPQNVPLFCVADSPCQE